MLTLRAHRPPWHLSCGGCQSPVADRLSRRPFCGLAGSSPCTACRGSPGGAHRASGGASGCDGELRGDKGPEAMGLDRHGHTDTTNPCLPCRGSQSRACAAGVGQSACGVPLSLSRFTVYGILCLHCKEAPQRASVDGTLLCPASLLGAPHALTTHDLIGINLDKLSEECRVADAVLQAQKSLTQDSTMCTMSPITLV